MLALGALQLVAIVVAYLLGAIPFGYLMGRVLKHDDIRHYGSGATGGTNVLRVMGWGPALGTAALDILKGAVAVWLGAFVDRLTGGGLFGAPGWTAALCGVAAVAGHSWPIYLGFRGGKSVATGGGGLLVFAPVTILYALPVFILTVALTRYVSLASLLTTLTAVVVIFLMHDPASIEFWVVCTALIIIYRHNANIKRLLAGKESRFGQKVTPR